MNESIHKDIIDLFINVLEDIESIHKNNDDFLRKKWKNGKKISDKLKPLFI